MVSGDSGWSTGFSFQENLLFSLALDSGVLINSPAMRCFLVYDLDVIWTQYNPSVLKK
ncbi:unnamed protein product [Brassica rapa subsp. narinosa]